MYKGTTPTIILTLPVDLSEAEVYVTVADGKGEVIATVDETMLDISVVDGVSEISVFMTQEMTLAMPTGEAKIQVNWLYGDKRACSDIKTVLWRDNLYNEVLGGGSE